METRTLGLLLGALTTAFLASASLATSSQATAIDLQLASKKPGSGTAMRLRIGYTKTGYPDGKPSPIRRLQIDAPAGTVFHSARVPACSASDLQLRLLGPRACPPASRIGGGPITVITGFGKPFDPFVAPTPVFNDGRGWLEVSQIPSTPITIAITRLRVTGSRISGTIAPSPGGPPDLQSAVSTLDLSFPESTGYITTPPTCPAAGRWITTGRFTFADGTTQVVRGSTPCASTAARPGPGLRMRLGYRRGRTRGGRVCARSRVRARVLGRDSRHVRRVLFVRGRRHFRVDRRVPFRRVVHRPHRGRSHRHRVRARVRMRDGRVLRFGRSFRACGRRR